MAHHYIAECTGSSDIPSFPGSLLLATIDAVDRGVRARAGPRRRRNAAQRNATASDCVQLLRCMPVYIAAYVALIGSRDGPTSDVAGGGS